MRKSTHLELSEDGDVIDSDDIDECCSVVEEGFDLSFLAVIEGGFHAEAPTILISDCVIFLSTQHRNDVSYMKD